MQDFDIRGIHHKNRLPEAAEKKYFAAHINFDSVETDVQQPNQEETTAESMFQQGAELARVYEASERIRKIHQNAKPKSIFRYVFQKQAALLAFTFFVLGFGIFLGARFVTFANSISTSKLSFYKTVANNIGAALGPVIPGLSQLDDTKIAEAIRKKEKINILLLGYGGEGHSGSYLTDTIILLNVDFKSGNVNFLPIPRDLWVKIPTRGYDGSYAKINAAYSFGLDELNFPNKLPQFTAENGGGSLAIYAVSQVTGIKADYYAAVDFYGFKQIVDILHGVEVNVENAFTDYSYPSGDQNVNAPSCVAEDIPDSIIANCRYKKVHFDAGPQVLAGSRALEYARSRHAAGVEGSDFARSKRQQKLLAAIEAKALSIGALPQIFKIMDSLQGHFKTNLSLAEIKDISKYLSQSNSEKFTNFSITDNNLLISTYSEDRQWILLPARGIGNWQDIQNFVKEAFKSTETSVE